ncbi:SDR family NAD(P)-dependent oxidoreductase [Aspergillus novofumigatus IBT 16806]|uniref:Short-chain dehydrogenase n=1 Tax=Aspergillus novofumigatus (strain IBT 16806) TaxID=1392255 RepID=A0A2I1CJZ9_ASPN1|nr:short-chain dehydrogenase [Aspergillus novofumigatus IBT 16806]PKX97941.1 short-chain dehydrogenase [Aspergillus novofumigatus IBT 16806]
MTSPKVALITGSSRGVGAAIARCLAEEGMSIVINYNSDPAPAERLLQEMRASNQAKVPGADVSHYAAFQANLADRSGIQQLVQQTIQTMGRLDVVVSNVGWTRMTNFMNLDEADDETDWDRCFSMNVKSHFQLFRVCQEHLERSEGVFIATASVAGLKPSGSSLPYAVTKAALIHLIKSLAIIAAPKIRVNSVSPGVLLTDWGLQFPEEKLNAVKEKNLLKRFATPEDVAEQVKVFATSKSMTGVNAVIDAGFSV